MKIIAINYESWLSWIRQWLQHRSPPFFRFSLWDQAWNAYTLYQKVVSLLQLPSEISLLHLEVTNHQVWVAVFLQCCVSVRNFSFWCSLQFSSIVINCEDVLTFSLLYSCVSLTKDAASTCINRDAQYAENVVSVFLNRERCVLFSK